MALWAGAHLALHAPNAMIVGTMRGYHNGWYHEVITQPIHVEDGQLSLAKRPGLATDLREEVLNRPDAQVEVSSPATLPDMSHA